MKIVQVSLRPYMFAEYISHSLTIPVPTILDAGCSVCVLSLSSPWCCFHTVLIHIQGSGPSPRALSANEMKITADNFATLLQQKSMINVKRNCIWNSFLRDGSEVKTTISFVSSTWMCGGFMYVLIAFWSKTLHAHPSWEGGRQKRCHRLLCGNALRYYCDKCSVGKHKG